MLTIAIVLLFKVINPPTSMFMLTADQPAKYAWVAIEEISPAMQLAVIAAEDQQFPHHNGFDWEQLQLALDDYAAGKSLRGASTISQQTAKNLFAWRGRSWFRKAYEAWFTWWLERLWSKSRILEVYLNVAQFDAHRYGVQLAAAEYFQTTADTLNTEQAARLASVLPSPENRSIFLPNEKTRRHQRWIQQQMQNLGIGYLQRLEDEKASSEP